MNTALNIVTAQALYMEEPSAETQRKGGVFMPIKLRTILLDYEISQAEYAGAIKQKNGQPLSASAVSGMLKWNRFLKATPKESIVKQTASFLKSKGVSAGEIKTAFDEELDNEKRKSATSRNKKSPHEISLVGGHVSLSDELQNTTEVVMLSQDAKRHFKLSRNPFKDDMNGIDDVFMSTQHRTILLAMRQAARFGGLIAVVGESGAGKSVMRNALLHELEQSDDEIIVIQPQIVDKKKASANSLLDAIIQDIDPNASIPNSSERKARKAHSVLSASRKAGNKHVLIQEEAHKHESSIFPFYKQLWEFESGFNKLLGIVLIGQPELKYHLSLQHNWDSREFINRCEVAELEPLDACLEEYLKFKFERVGADVSQIIADDAYDFLRETMFVNTRAGRTSILHPLFIHNRIVQAMNLCAEIGMPHIDAAVLGKVKL